MIPDSMYEIHTTYTKSFKDKIVLFKKDFFFYLTDFSLF